MARFNIIENSRLTDDAMAAIRGGDVYCRPKGKYQSGLCVNWYEYCPRRYYDPDEPTTCRGKYTVVKPL